MRIRLRRQSRRAVEKGTCAFNSDYACAFECGIVHCVFACKRAAVGKCGFACFSESPSFNQYDGFFPCELTRGTHKFPRVLYRFDVKHYGFSLRVGAEVIDEIADESRLLNDRLGRKRVTLQELQDLLAQAGLAGKAQIIEEGGVWILLRK